MSDLKPVVEALLFGADGPLRCERLAEVLEVERSVVIEALRALEADYAAQPRGIFLQEVAGEPANLVEFGKTSEIFTSPCDKRTEDYITGRFG